MDIHIHKDFTTMKMYNTQIDWSRCGICGHTLNFEVKMCCDGKECGCMGLPIEPPICSQKCADIFCADHIESRKLKYDYAWDDRREELRDRRKRELSRTDLKIGDIVTVGCREYWWRITRITSRKYRDSQIPMVLKRLLVQGDDMSPLITAELIVELAPQIAIHRDKNDIRSKYVDMKVEIGHFDSSWIEKVDAPQDIKRPSPVFNFVSV